MKQVDLLFLCPETGKRVAVEVCKSTFDTEIEQGRCDLENGADAVIIVCPNHDILAKLEKTFTDRVGSKADPRITLAMPCHLIKAPSLRHVYECPDLVYDVKWDVSAKIGKKGGAKH